jgi:polyisoprenoid-binding protein YceI
MLRALLLTSALLPLVACGDVGDAPVAETREVATPGGALDAPLTGTPLPLDTAATRIEWRAAKVTRAHDGGFRRFDGTLYLDGEQLTGAEVVIDATSIHSDTDRLTTHLLSEDFFEVTAYPEARFQATGFEPLAAADTAGAGVGATHRVTGLLTIRDRTNEVAFPARVAVTPEAVTAEADFIIDRQQWGLAYPGQPDDLIRDEVRILLYAMARRAGEPGTAAPTAP